MARIRTIKPEFFTHWELFSLELETGLPVRVAFAGLWTQADREGRFRWIPQQLKLGCLPYDTCDFARVLDALETRGFIVKYRVENCDYGYIPGWKTHQVINNRESDSHLPEPSDTNTLTRAPRVEDATVTPLEHALVERKGKEGKEGKGREETRETRVIVHKKIKHEKFVPKTWLTTRGVPIDIVEDWLKIRIAKKLVHTERAFEAVAKEAAQANMSLPDAIEYCVRKSWGGFEAQWIENERARAGNGGNGPARMTHAQASTLAAARTIFGDERKLQNGQGNVIDVTPSPVTGFLDSKDL